MSPPACHPLHRQRRRRLLRQRGFTLIELVVVVLIVGITAALATPTVVNQMRERRSRDTAQQVALLYSKARMRALARGAAVMVQYNQATGFQVRESVEGAVAAGLRGNPNCADQPGLGCLTTQWNNPAAPDSREVQSMSLDPALTISAVNAGGASVNTMAICFTPLGRSFVSYNGAPTTVMAGAPGVSIRRGDFGIERRVVILPNGTARVAL